MLNLFSGIRIFPYRMRQNLDLSGGLIMSEAIMLELGRQIGRQQAHDAVYEAAQASFIQGRPFSQTLAEEPQVSRRLTPDQIQALLDPTAYTEYAAYSPNKAQPKPAKPPPTCKTSRYSQRVLAFKFVISTLKYARRIVHPKYVCEGESSVIPALPLVIPAEAGSTRLTRCPDLQRQHTLRYPPH